MTIIEVRSTVGDDGVLRLEVPLPRTEAGREVRVTGERAPPSTMTPEEWSRGVLNLAGRWLGEFERPPQGEYEVRDPLP